MLIPINDPILSADPKFKSEAGVYAFDIATGRPLWSYKAEPNCAGQRGKDVAACTTKYGFSAAPIVVDGAMVGATLGGEVIILDTADGRVLNRLDTIGTRTRPQQGCRRQGRLDREPRHLRRRRA